MTYRAAAFTADFDGTHHPRHANNRRNKKNRYRPPQPARPAPAVLSVPGPGRYFVHVEDDGRVTVQSLNGKSIVDADGTAQLQSDIAYTRSALLELASRMRIVAGDMGLSAVAQPLRVALNQAAA